MNEGVYNIVCLTVFITIFSNCRNAENNNNKHYLDRLYKDNRFLIKEAYDSSGKIKLKQYFNKDTVPDGAMIEYYSNGKIAKWRWFRAKHKNPDCGIFYNEDGSFDTLKGKPFLAIGNDADQNPVIELINPPQVKFTIGYKDYYENKMIKKIYYDPILTDTISWVPLDEYKKTKGHEYIICFYIIDSVKNKILYQDSINLKER
jgi:hypothetical protein